MQIARNYGHFKVCKKQLRQKVPVKFSQMQI